MAPTLRGVCPILREKKKPKTLYPDRGPKLISRVASTQKLSIFRSLAPLFQIFQRLRIDSTRRASLFPVLVRVLSTHETSSRSVLCCFRFLQTRPNLSFPCPLCYLEFSETEPRVGRAAARSVKKAVDWTNSLSRRVYRRGESVFTSPAADTVIRVVDLSQGSGRRMKFRDITGEVERERERERHEAEISNRQG